ncbi:hypothetical protein V6N13_048162 [Hibiscus sabdariffa]|uniref:Uncharacterized protein n=1 Tax=Hibiscus sabdariffa TaxID=183260 RepID=A0ABR2F6E6_9ROSI
MIGTIVKTNTRKIKLNMVDYLRVGITLDVTKPVQRCVTIGVVALNLENSIDAESSTNVPANQARQLDTIPAVQLVVPAAVPDKVLAAIATPNDASLAAHVGADPILNINLGAAMHTTLVTTKVTTITVDSIGLTLANEVVFPTKETDDLDKDMGKYFLPTPSMLSEFKEWLFKNSPSHTAPFDKGTMVSTLRGTKRHSLLHEETNIKKASTPATFFKK